MRNVVTDGAKTDSIPIRGGGVKISTDDRRGERCGGHVCKIAKWKTGGNLQNFYRKGEVGWQEESQNLQR